jgi:DHA2 family lincomycin resistance protein-like MFS transporter
VFSIGLGMAMTPLMTTALGALPKNLYSHGSAILNTLQQLAGAAGTAILIAIYSAVSESQMADGVGTEIAIADGANSAFLVGAWLAVIGLVFTVFVSTSAPKKAEVTTVVTEEPKTNT